MKENKKYEIFNVVDDNGDSIYAASIDELPLLEGGEVYISIDVIPEIRKFLEDWKRG
jgi:hypothetical protein